MKVNIAVRHGHLTAEHQAEIIAKVEKLHHFFERLSGLHVIVDLAGHDKTVEIQGNADHKHDFVATAKAPDVMAAVHGAMEKMKHQLKHYKETVQDHRRDPSHGGEAGIHP